LALVVGSTTTALADEATPEVGTGADVDLQPVAENLVRPLFATEAPDDTDRLFVLEQRGTVRVVEDGHVQEGYWLDIRDRTTTTSERGLLGLAFHPNFAENGEVYVSSTGPDGDSRLVRHVLSDPVADQPGSAPGEILLEVDQPYANHNAGHLAFGPEGHLYYSLGDGGSAGDPQENGQNPHTLLGTILRLDVSPDTGYAIPEDNPFDGEEGAPEVWAYGLRNPWRFSFDRATGDLWIGDVGQNTIEEVNREPVDSDGGHNYGWKIFEGHLPYAVGVPDSVPTFPVMEYTNGAGTCSVTGGYVYHGDAIEDLQGTYVFGDLCSGEIYGGLGTGSARVVTTLAETDATIASFGQDAAGELYVVDYTGTVYQLVAA
jgi:glucose/arabinose dehydrogenase